MLALECLKVCVFAPETARVLESVCERVPESVRTLSVSACVCERERETCADKR